MKKTFVTTMAVIASVSAAVCLAQDQAFLKEVESRMRRIANNDEGLADPREFERLQKAMSEGGDWDSALLRLIDLHKYDQQIIGPAIRVLQLRGSFGRPEVQAAVITYFNARVKAARAHDRSDPLFDPVVRTGIGGLSSSFAKSGGPDLLLAVLDFAASTEERSNPLLDKYTWATIGDALLEKGDSRHLDGMRKLLAVTQDVAVKEKLERAIARVTSEARTTPPEPSPTPPIPRPLMLSTPVPAATPLPSAPVAKVAETPVVVAEPQAPVWPWVVGIAALAVIGWLVLKRRT